MSGGSALLDLSSFPRLYIESEYFESNSDASSDVIEYYNTSAYSMSDASTYTITNIMKNSTLYPSNSLGQGIIKLRKVIDVKIYNTSFGLCWFLETIQYD